MLSEWYSPIKLSPFCLVSALLGLVLGMIALAEHRLLGVWRRGVEKNWSTLAGSAQWNCGSSCSARASSLAWPQQPEHPQKVLNQGRPERRSGPRNRPVSDPGSGADGVLGSLSLQSFIWRIKRWIQRSFLRNSFLNKSLSLCHT